MLPAYLRPEYTEKCFNALKEAQEYNGRIYPYSDDSLRESILKFFKDSDGVDIIAKVDNDCIVPKNWLNDILDIFSKTDVDILSPNVLPSNAAYHFGEEGEEYRPSKIIGGLWVMRRSIIDGIVFEDYDVKGIKGAFNILKQIINEKDPKIGWAHNVTVQDIGHWSGVHEDHIKSDEHREYSQAVGREVAW
jgi:hypothetical protein